MRDFIQKTATIDPENHPYLFTTDHADTLSANYTQVNTSEYLNILLQSGWRIHSVNAPKTTKASTTPIEFKQHMIKLVPEDINGGLSKTLRSIGDSVPMIWLENSHNGKKALRLTAGLMRLICTNGLAIVDDEIQAIALRHNQINLDDLKEVFDSYGRTISMIVPTIKDMQKVTLTDSQRLELAHTSMQIRFNEEQRKNFRESDLLRPRRHADSGNSLWNTYNVIQENCIKGGIPGINMETRRRVRTKSISSANADLAINKQLWMAAQAYL